MSSLYYNTTTDEGEYTCEVCTVFGLDKEEVKTLCGVGLKFTDQNKEAEGYEVKTSAFKASNKIKSYGAMEGTPLCLSVSPWPLIRKLGHARAGTAFGIRAARGLPSDCGPRGQENSHLDSCQGMLRVNDIKACHVAVFDSTVSHI